MLDDCKPEDGPRLIERIRTALGEGLRFGFAQCPGDGLDPSRLLDLADERLRSGRT